MGRPGVASWLGGWPCPCCPLAQSPGLHLYAQSSWQAWHALSWPAPPCCAGNPPEMLTGCVGAAAMPAYQGHCRLLGFERFTNLFRLQCMKESSSSVMLLLTLQCVLTGCVECSCHACTDWSAVTFCNCASTCLTAKPETLHSYTAVMMQSP